MKTANDVLARAKSKEEFNTCNGWGFGGGIGVEYKFRNGFRIRTGTAYYRHLPSCHFVAIYNSEGHRIYDRNTFPSAEELISILNLKGGAK